MRRQDIELESGLQCAMDSLEPLEVFVLLPVNGLIALGDISCFGLYVMDRTAQSRSSQFSPPAALTMIYRVCKQRFTAWPTADGRSDELRTSWGSIAKRWVGILRLSKPANPIAGFEEGEARKPAIRSPGSKQVRTSQTQPFRSPALEPGAGVTANRWPR
jgi:hypothetical protein